MILTIFLHDGHKSSINQRIYIAPIIFYPNLNFCHICCFQRQNQMSSSENQSNKFKSSLLAFNHIFSMFAPRRNLRNTNTCPTVTNPFHPSQGENLQALPPQIRHLLRNAQKLTCDQIHSIPDLNPESSLETELTGMREAAERQKKEMLETCNITQQKIEEEASIIQVLPTDPQKKKFRHQELVQEIIFENELEEFINTPHFDDL